MRHSTAESASGKMPPARRSPWFAALGAPAACQDGWHTILAARGVFAGTLPYRNGRVSRRRRFQQMAPCLRVGNVRNGRLRDPIPTGQDGVGDWLGRQNAPDLPDLVGSQFGAVMCFRSVIGRQPLHHSRPILSRALVSTLWWEVGVANPARLARCAGWQFG